MAKKSEEVKDLYPLDVLRANCKEIFNIEKEVFDGVFYAHDGEISKEEAETKIKKWLGKEVK